MQKARSILGIALTIMLASMVQPRCVWACDCDAPSIADASDGAVAIFAGEVTAVVPSAQEISSATFVAVTFAVSRVWKGAAQPTITITTARWEPSCGYEFQKGQEYLVYARAVDTTLVPKQRANIVLQTGFCSRTQPLADATADLAALGERQAPTATTAQIPQPSMLPDTSGEVEQPALNLRPLVMLGALGVVTMGFAGCVLRRRVL